MATAEEGRPGRATDPEGQIGSDQQLPSEARPFVNGGDAGIPPAGPRQRQAERIEGHLADQERGRGANRADGEPRVEGTRVGGREGVNDVWPVPCRQRLVNHARRRVLSLRVIGSSRAILYNRDRVMPQKLETVRPIELNEIRAARERIAGTILRTPLVRLELGPDYPDIRLKLENLQPINAYKLRGAANAVAMLSDADRERGVWTISAGNAGQGVAYAARKAGVPCTVVAIETAPASKLERMRALGATLVPVPYDVAWKALEERAFPGVEGTFVHPFDDHNFIAGHATMGLEILEDAPDAAPSSPASAAAG